MFRIINGIVVLTCLVCLTISTTNDWLGINIMKSKLSLRVGRSVSCLLLLIVTFSSCTSSPEVKSARYLENGKQQMRDKKDIPRAILAFQNAVKTTPRNPEAYYQLALADLAA